MIILPFTNDQANVIDITGVDASVTAFCFCSKTSWLAVGNECGMVRKPFFVEYLLDSSLDFNVHLILAFLTL